MKITPNPRVPAGGSVLRAYLAELHEGGIAPDGLQNSSLDAIEAGLPHYVRDISLDELAAGGADLGAAAITGVRYLLRGEEGLCAAADLGLAPDHKHVDRVKALISGVHIKRLEQSLDQVERYASTQEAEMSLVHCRGINLDVLLLHPRNGDKLVFPLLNGAPSLKGHVYLEREFLDAVQPEARRALKRHQGSARNQEDPLEG